MSRWKTPKNPINTNIPKLYFQFILNKLQTSRLLIPKISAFPFS
ncbi:hypothetical protein GCWU000321_00408 [Dialister invisus DSM 15470]|uniref:Uncharacterized protein n=1 Tax=Dialister invisus DSM 15470 TaxID=592028 RepID=C9LRD4_9FIRM|nr:hypothetical protein GCWU000321_00408 [Dialister invisus DSM 15470]